MYRVRQAAEALEIDENEGKKEKIHTILAILSHVLSFPPDPAFSGFSNKFELYQKHDPPLIPIDNNNNKKFFFF